MIEKPLSELALELKPYIVPWIKASVGGAGYATSTLGVHDLNGVLHTGTLARSQAPWVASDIATHAALPDVHHARQHSIVGGDHTASGAALDIVGLTAPNALGILTPSSSPGAASAILKSSAAGNLTLPTFTASTKLTSPLIDTAAGNLTLSPAASFVKLAASKGIESNGTFVSGFTGSGMRLDDGITKAGKTSIEADNLTVRGTMRVYELVIQQIRMTNGSLLVSSAGKVKAVSGSGPYTVTTDGQHGFAVNDLILAQRWNPTQGALTGTYIYRSALRVTAITTVGTDWQFTGTLLEGDAPIEGAEYGRIGNTTDTNRQGGVYLTSDDTYAPYIDIYNDVDSMADWTGAAKLKVRLGRLDGISDAVLNPSGYGLYSANVFLKGVVSAANDVVRLDSTGVRVKATTSSTYTSANAYRFANASDVEMGGLYGRDYGSAFTVGFAAYGDLTHAATAAVDAKLGAGGGDAKVILEARDSAGTHVANVTVWATNTQSFILIGAADYTQFNMQTRSIGGHRPLTDLGASLGEASYRWGTVYANQIIATTISGATMSGAEWEYAGNMVIDANSASANTTVSIVNQAAGAWVANLAVEGSITSGGVAVSLAGHNHNDLYFTEAESDARYVQTATLSGYVLKTGDTMTGPLLAPAGTVSAPAWAFSGSTGTGLYRQAADSLGVATAGVERLRVDASGRVSVGGAPTASFALTVNALPGIASGQVFEGTYTTYVQNFNATIRHAATSTAQAIRSVVVAEPQGDITVLYGLNNNLQLDNSAYTVANLRMVAAALTRNAGFAGTVTTLANFYAGATGGSSGAIGTHYGYYCAPFADGGTNYAFYSAGTTQSSFGGNVGIGNDAPVSLLDVAATTGAVLTLRRVDTSVVANDMIGKIQFYAADASSTTNFIVADIEAQAISTVTTDINPGRLIFRTTSVAVAATPVERLRIDSAGITVTGDVIAPAVTTASGNLTLSSAGGTVAFGGQALSGTNWSVSASGAASFAPATDTTHDVGQARLGFMSGAANHAVFAQRDNATLTNFSLLHTPFGDSVLNGSTLVGVWVNGAEVLSINSARGLPAGSGLKDWGDYNRRWRTIHAEELAVQTLVAQNVIATIGGDIIVTPTTKLISDVTSAAGGIGLSALYTNLVAYWKLNEGSGDRYDSKGGNTLTSTNSVGMVATGIQENAAQFVKASSQRLSATDNSALSVGDIDFYVACWVYGTLDDGTSQYIAAKAGSSGNRAWYLLANWSSDRIQFRVFDGTDASATVTANTFGAIATGQWYFVEAWHSAASNQVGVAVNGVSDTTSWTTGARDDTGPFQIGAANSSSHFDGYVDEFGYWKNYIPNSTERTWLYNAGVGRTLEQMYVYGVTDINLDVEHNNLRSGEWILLKTAPAGLQQTEKMLITSSYTPVTVGGKSGYRYTASRDQDGTGPNNWYIGDAVASQQKNVGEGHLWLTATTTVHGHTGPALIGYVRTGALVNDIKPVFAKGNLRSFVDYVSDEYGDAAGNDLTLLPNTGFAGYTIDRTAGLRLFNASIKLYNAGVQTVNIDSSGADIWIGPSSADKRLAWNGTALSLNDANLIMTSAGTETLRITQAEGIRIKAGAAAQNQIDVFSATDKVYAQWTQLDGTFNNTETLFESYGKPGLGMGTLTLRSRSADGLDSAYIAIGSTYINLVGKPVTIFNGATINGGTTLNNTTTLTDRGQFRTGAGGTAGMWYADSSGNNRSFAGLHTDSATPIWGVWNNGNWRMLIDSAGNVGIAGGLTVAPGSTSVRGIDVNMPTSTTVEGVRLQYNGTTAVQLFALAGDRAIVFPEFNNGSSYGPYINIGRNSNVTTPAAGHLLLYDRDNDYYSIWPDGSGNLRIVTNSHPTSATDTGGTVIGTQTSWIGAKEAIDAWDGGEALAAVLSVPLYSYRLKLDASGRRYQGLVISDEDRGAWFSDNDSANQTPVLNERNLFGYLIAAIKAQQVQIEELRRQLDKRERADAHTRNRE